MKILIKKGSVLFDRLYDLHILMKIANAAAEEVAKKHNAIAYKRSVYNIAGGIIGLKFDKQPNKREYRISPNVNGLFMPRNTEAKKEIAELPVVTCKDLNDLIGFKSGWYGERLYPHPGIITCEDYVLLSIQDEVAVNFKLIEGMEEIKFSEYQLLINSINNIQ